MVLLLQRLSHSLQFLSKLEDHHHHHHHHNHNHHQSEGVLSVSLDAFRSCTSNAFNQILLNSKPDSQTISLSWIHHCFKLFPIINETFTNLLMEIEHPFTKWEDTSIEEYLNYTKNLLDLLNAISSSLSNLAHSRLSLSHALSLFTNSPSSASVRSFKPIEIISKPFSKDLIGNINKKNGDQCSVLTKELIVHQALMVLKCVSFSACGIFLSSLSNNHDQITYLRDRSYLTILGSNVLKEVKDVNDAVESLSKSIFSVEKISDAMEDLERKLEVLEHMLDCVGHEVDRLFRDVLTRRNELLNCVRQKPK